MMGTLDNVGHGIGAKRKVLRSTASRCRQGRGPDCPERIWWQVVDLEVIRIALQRVGKQGRKLSSMDLLSLLTVLKADSIVHL